jgi:hypothetical protein
VRRAGATRAAPSRRAYESVRFQPDQRLAQRRARHVQLLGQIALGGQALAGQKRAVRDQFANLTGHDIGEAHASVRVRMDGLKTHRWTLMPVESW